MSALTGEFYAVCLLKFFYHLSSTETFNFCLQVLLTSPWGTQNYPHMRRPIHIHLKTARFLTFNIISYTLLTGKRYRGQHNEGGVFGAFNALLIGSV